MSGLDLFCYNYSMANKTIRDLLARYPGKYSARLGIDVDGKEPERLFEWFLAALLYGARISGALAERAWREFMARGLDNPQRLLDTGWDGLVEALDAGGYARYDFKTADKLLEASRNLLQDYGGDLNVLHNASRECRELVNRLSGLGKGIGEVTADIFLRELRGVWPKADPPVSPLAKLAALKLGLIKEGDDPLKALQRIWGEGIPGKDFRDLEAALVAAGLELRRKKVA
jgi:endonuclease III